MEEVEDWNESILPIARQSSLPFQVGTHKRGGLLKLSTTRVLQGCQVNVSNNSSSRRGACVLYISTLALATPGSYCSLNKTTKTSYLPT